MFEEHAKVMQAIAATGEIIGRKKLQKMIYIAKKLNFPFYEKYDFHFFGPYSEELTLRIEELCNLQYLSEVKEKKNGFVQYRYTVTEDGEQFLGNFEALPHLESLMAKMNESSSRFLELVSTVCFFFDETREEVTEKIFRLKSKQKYTEDEIAEAYAYIAALQQMVH